MGGGFQVIVLFFIMCKRQKFTNYYETTNLEINQLLEAKTKLQSNFKWKLSKDHCYISVEKAHFESNYDE